MSETSTELAIRPDAGMARHNLDREITDSWIDVVSDVGKLAGYIADTEFVPTPLRGRAAAVAGVILYSREVGLPPMTGLAQTHVIEGKPSLSAEALRGLVFAAGHSIEVLATTGARCEMRGRRRGSETWTTVEWTIDMARAAELTGKKNWKRHPRQMLQARASAELCRLIFPDVVHGMGAAEELLDDVEAEGAAETEAPKTTVSRAKPRARQIPSGLPVAPAAAKPDTEPAALEVDIEPPATPPPNPPAGPADETPGPAAEEHTPEPVDADLPEELRLAAERAPEQDRPATVHQIRTEDQPKVSPGQLRLLGANWTRLGVTNDLDRRAFTALMIDRELAGGTTKDVTQPEAKRLIDVLGRLETPDALDNLIGELQQRGGDED